MFTIPPGVRTPGRSFLLAISFIVAVTSPLSGQEPTEPLEQRVERLETQVAIGTLVRRFDELSLESESTEWGRSLFRVPGRIPVRFVEARG